MGSAIPTYCEDQLNEVVTLSPLKSFQPFPQGDRHGLRHALTGQVSHFSSKTVGALIFDVQAHVATFLPSQATLVNIGFKHEAPPTETPG